MDVTIGIILSIVGTALSAAKFYEVWMTKRREVRPFLQIEFENYADKPLQISLLNKGLGPLRIMKMNIRSPDGNFDSFRKFISYYRFNGIKWSEFSSDLIGKILSSGEKPLIIMECENEQGDIALLREKLSQAVVSVSYMDIFDRMMPVVSRKCDWFSADYFEKGK